jgi:hypothetical protein
LIVQHNVPIPEVSMSEPPLADVSDFGPEIDAMVTAFKRKLQDPVNSRRYLEQVKSGASRYPHWIQLVGDWSDVADTGEDVCSHPTSAEGSQCE